MISSVGSCLQEHQEEILLGFSSLHKCFLYAKSFTDKLTPSLKTRCQEADSQVLGASSSLHVIGVWEAGEAWNPCFQNETWLLELWEFQGLQILREMPGKKEVFISQWWLASQVALVVKHPPANAGDRRDSGSIPGSGRSPWKRKWQLTPVLLPRESHGQRSLVAYSP